MYRHIWCIALIASLLLCLTTLTAFAYYGWDITDDPVPYYHQQAGFWYYTSDTKTFMIEFNDRTYKYIFERNGSFLGGYVTDMPLKLP
jgi:hypothetical protein